MTYMEDTAPSIHMMLLYWRATTTTTTFYVLRRVAYTVAFRPSTLLYSLPSVGHLLLLLWSFELPNVADARQRL